MGTKHYVDADTGDIWSVRHMLANGDISAQGDITAIGDIIASANMAAVNAVLTGDLTAVGGVFSGPVSGASAAFVGDVSAGSATISGSLSAGSATFSTGMSGGDGIFDKITINDPVTNAKDAATKEYVLAASLGFNWQLPVLSFEAAQPASPLDGDRYVATATAGDWTENNIYECDAASKTYALLTCGAAGDSTPANWAALAATAGFNITIDGAGSDYNPDFTGDLTMDDVAASIEVAFAGAATCVWDTDHFEISTTTLGQTGSISVVSAPGALVDIAAPGWMNGKVGVGVVTPASDGWIETAVVDRMALLNYDDSTFYSYMLSSLSWISIFMPSSHNDTLNKQGGGALEYYHLTLAEWNTINGGLKLYDTDSSHKLTLAWNENDTSNRILSFLVNNGNRSISLTGDLAVSAGCGTLNQSVASGSSPTFGTITASAISCDQLVPIGSIIPFYDFGAALTFNAANWKYCDGTAHDFGGAVGVKTLPDMSNRYLVGFGTEGGADIGGAAWDTAAVGEASHQINIAHTHSVPKHYHSRGTFAVSSSAGNNSASHTHSGTTALSLGAHNHSVTGGSHTHQITAYRGYGGGSSCIGSGVSSDPVTYDNTAADGGHTHSCGTTNLSHQHTITTGSQSANHNHSISNSYSGSIGCVAGSGGVDGDSDTTSGSQLSATQSIQPRSIRVRYIMRIA